MKQDNNILVLNGRMINKILNKFTNQNFKISFENDEIFIQGGFKIISYKIIAVIKDFNSSKITLNLKINPMFHVVIPYLSDIINEELNSKFPGLLKLNFPELYIDLSKLKLRDNICLTDLISIRNILISDAIQIEFD